MKTKQILLFFTIVFGAVYDIQAQSKIVFSYDSQGNRIMRQKVGLLQKKDPKILAEPLSNDSLFMANLDAPNDPNLQDTTELNQKKQDVVKTWIGEQDIAIYPNPSQGYLSIGLKNFNEVKSCSIEILDQNYRVVYKSTVPQQVYSIDLSDQSAGNYYIDIRVNGMLGSFVVVKE